MNTRLVDAATQSPRGAAALAFADALDGGPHVHDRIRALLAAGALDARDAGLAREIALGAVRHAHTIRAVLSRCARYDDRRVAPPLRAILYTAAYQLVWLDRIPEFAAVNEAVTLAIDVAGRSASAMVNAVLRNVVRAIAARRTAWQPLDCRLIRVGWASACAFRIDVLPPTEQRDEHLAAAAGETPARIRALRAAFGDAADGVAWASQALPPIVLRRNPFACTIDEFRAGCAPLGAAIVNDDRAYVPPAADLSATELLRTGRAYVQDDTARAAADAVAARPGQRVLDLCAAPGGKSAAIAICMGDTGSVVACDVTPQRVALIRENAERLRLTSVWPLLLAERDAASDSRLRELSPFDAVLVDAPCSNSGVIARRPEARLTLRPRKLRSLTALQAGLLDQAAGLTRDGGLLVYSTCSIEHAENQSVVDAFLSRHARWRVVEQSLTLPAWGEAIRDWRDGGFVATLTCDAR